MSNAPNTIPDRLLGPDAYVAVYAFLVSIPKQLREAVSDALEAGRIPESIMPRHERVEELVVELRREFDQWDSGRFASFVESVRSKVPHAPHPAPKLAYLMKRAQRTKEHYGPLGLDPLMLSRVGRAVNLKELADSQRIVAKAAQASAKGARASLIVAVVAAAIAGVSALGTWVASCQ